jgi:hypothetical protein
MMIGACCASCCGSVVGCSRQAATAAGGEGRNEVTAAVDVCDAQEAGALRLKRLAWRAALWNYVIDGGR